MPVINETVSGTCFPRKGLQVQDPQLTARSSEGPFSWGRHMAPVMGAPLLGGGAKNRVGVEVKPKRTGTGKRLRARLRCAVNPCHASLRPPGRGRPHPTPGGGLCGDPHHKLLGHGSESCRLRPNKQSAWQPVTVSARARLPEHAGLCRSMIETQKE